MRIVEDDAVWRKSSHSDNDGTCVEVANLAGKIGIRDSKDIEGGRLAVTGEVFAAFLHTITAK